MPAVVRVGDKGSGHGNIDFPEITATEGSPNVFCNGKAVVRLGDKWGPHTGIIDYDDDDNPIYETHEGTSSSGSSTVFVNGKACCRVGDSISCGSTMEEGSSDVFAN